MSIHTSLLTRSPLFPFLLKILMWFLITARTKWKPQDSGPAAPPSLSWMAGQQMLEDIASGARLFRCPLHPHAAVTHCVAFSSSLTLSMPVTATSRIMSVFTKMIRANLCLQAHRTAPKLGIIQSFLCVPLTPS